MNSVANENIRKDLERRLRVINILSWVLPFAIAIGVIGISYYNKKYGSIVVCDRVCYPNRNAGVDWGQQKCICDMTREYREIP